MTMKRIQIFLTLVTLLGASLIREASSLGIEKIEILASDTVQLKQWLEHQSLSAMFSDGSYRRAGSRKFGLVLFSWRSKSRRELLHTAGETI